MPLNPEQLASFDEDDDFSARLAKIDYILEHGSEEEISQHLNRAYQEASLQYLAQQAFQLQQGERTFSHPDYGDIKIRRKHPNMYPTVTVNNRPLFINGEGFTEVTNRLNAIDRLLATDTSSGYPSPEVHQAYRRVLDTLSLPLFQDVKFPEPKAPEPPTDEP